MAISAQQAADEDLRWSKQQRRLTEATTAATATGATALGLMLAGKTKVGGRVLPKKVRDKLRTERADDVRNTIALAGMVGGVASGANWARKLKRDTDPSRPVVTPEQKAANLAAAMKTDLSKGWSRSTTVRRPMGAISRRRASFRGPAKKLVRRVIR